MKEKNSPDSLRLNMKKREKQIIASAVIFLTLFYFGISLVQYFSFSYTGLDLAIFNNVFWNTSQGNIFAFSFHGPTYLGDHFSIFIIILAPLYALAKHPIMLLFFQAAVIGAGLVPLYALSKKIHQKNTVHYVLLSMYIFSTLIGSVALSEFHMLAFFIPMGIATYYFYHTKNFTLFVLFFILTLFIREDISLVLIMFSLLAFIERRSTKWKLFPGVFTPLYGYLAFSSIQTASHDSYKFLFHYDHLGSSIFDIIINLVTQPQHILGALTSPYAVTFIFYLITPLLFLPLLSKKHLIFILPPLIQFSLSNTGLLSLIQTHYMALFIPFLFVATVFGYKNLTQKFFKLKKDQNVVLISMVVVSIASFIGLSGIRDIFPLILPNTDTLKKSFNEEAVKQGHVFDHVTANLETLPHLSGKKTIYPWSYVLKGKEQYRTTNIDIPKSNMLILDSFESLLYEYYYDISRGTRSAYYDSKIERVESIHAFFNQNKLGTKIIADELLIFTDNSSSFPMSKIKSASETIIKNVGGLTINAITQEEKTTIQLSNREFTVLPMRIFYSSSGNLNTYDLRLIFRNESNIIIKDKIIPLTYGLYSTDLWMDGEYVTVDYQFVVPQELVDTKYTVSISLIEIEKTEVYNNLNGIDYSLGIKNAYEEIPLNPLPKN